MLITLPTRAVRSRLSTIARKRPESTPTMFLHQRRIRTKKVPCRLLVIGVPVSVRGFYDASKRDGQLLEKRRRTRMKLARDGYYVVDEVLARFTEGTCQGKETLHEIRTCLSQG